MVFSKDSLNKYNEENIFNNDFNYLLRIWKKSLKIDDLNINDLKINEINITNLKINKNEYFYKKNKELQKEDEELYELYLKIEENNEYINDLNLKKNNLNNFLNNEYDFLIRELKIITITNNLLIHDWISKYNFFNSLKK